MNATKIKKNLKKFLDLWKEGEIHKVIAPQFIKKRIDDIPSKYWSFGNRILMYLAGTEDARGFRQWEAVGRRVKRGAKAFHILAPRFKKVKVKRKEVVKIIDPDTGEEIEKEVEIEDEERILTGFMSVPVFRVEDTEGDPLPEPKYEPVKKPPLFNLAKKFGIEVEWKPGEAAKKQYFGYFSPREKKIVLFTEDPVTFFHELSHAVRDALVKKGISKKKSSEEEEIIVETVAGTLALIYGYKDMVPFSVKYVEDYRKKAGIKSIFSLLKEIEEVLNYILGVPRN